MRAVVDPSTWDRGPAVEAVLATGRVDEDEAWRTFNMGVGMCLVVAPAAVEEVVAAVPGARRIGSVAAGDAGVEIG
jgi:phosphoribosylformylglycinamidine cyclo-ligase